MNNSKTVNLIQADARGREWRPNDLPRIREILGVSMRSSLEFVAQSPFSADDVTAGSETEYQAVVEGTRECVDLPLGIKNSNYFKNLQKRSKAGETPSALLDALEAHLANNSDNVWENSWVRFPLGLLSEYAKNVFQKDLLADKKMPADGWRNDMEKFSIIERGELHLRIPVSYLLKLSLADAISSATEVHPVLKQAGAEFMSHFLSDNSSPETYSFCPIYIRPNSTGNQEQMGRMLAQETAKRFLLAQLLTQYANQKFRLAANGQKALVYLAPHPHTRQKELNNIISDSFYRELFMSPCLSGWDQGEKKQEYMHLCHKVLSRSQLNAVAKLKEGGIITRNLVILPNLSNISLANNGTHISIGSRKLTAALQDPAGEFTPRDEKYYGDLAIKIVEHFLPLFVGTYSAAPYRLDFADFHPERALGFLPHELDFTHLRMIWRRWKKKAGLKVFGNPVTPFGPPWLDRAFSRVFGLRGDFVPDFRLIDYLVALLSTDESPALDGTPGNDLRLKRDLAELGVFDPAMAVYLLYRQRIHSVMGFSGFEGRYYSLFENFTDDMGDAASLQILITALAYQYILRGEITHADIPDTPGVESERRQIFFGAAIGIPTFFAQKESQNRFLRKILHKTKRTRTSHRYAGYLRVYNLEYRRALIDLISDEAKDLIASWGLADMLQRLRQRTEEPQTFSAAGKLTKGILSITQAANPLQLDSREFNLAAERFYRNQLRKRHCEEAYSLLEQDMRQSERFSQTTGADYRQLLKPVLQDKSATDYLAAVKAAILQETASADTLRAVIQLMLASILADKAQNHISEASHAEQLSATSIH